MSDPLGLMDGPVLRRQLRRRHGEAEALTCQFDFHAVQEGTAKRDEIREEALDNYFLAVEEVEEWRKLCEFVGVERVT
jgi:hypothetical protein